MSKSLRKQRWWLWQQNPRCFWCGVKTVLPSKKWKGPVSPKVATIDHIRPRHHPGRLEPSNGEMRHVLSCWKCNNDRDRYELSMKPKEWFYKNGQTAPLAMRSLGELRRVEAILAAKTPERKADVESVARSLAAVREAIAQKSEVA